MFRRWLVNRIKERSTWLGLVTLATVAGAGWSEVEKDLIVQAGVAVGAAIVAITADNGPQ